MEALQWEKNGTMVAVDIVVATVVVVVVVVVALIRFDDDGAPH